MKDQIKLLLSFSLIIFVGCEPEDEETEIADGNLFILCEGNFGYSNASLWSLDLEDDLSEPQSNIYETLTGNALGDVAQSMYEHEDRLFIVNNNSHTVEVLDLDDDAVTFHSTIDVNGSIPRYMGFNGTNAYVTTWYNGILVIDLDNMTIYDTIEVNGMLEDIIISDQNAFVSISMNSDWSTNDEVVKIDLNSGSVTDTINVVSGPGRMLLNEDELYVASTYYGADWSANHGMSKINTSSGNIDMSDHGSSYSFGSDIVMINGQLFRSTSSGMLGINSDLSVNETVGVADYDGVYSLKVVNDHIMVGTSDYVAPDTVYITDTDHQLIRYIIVGTLPTDFVISD